MLRTYQYIAKQENYGAETTYILRQVVQVNGAWIPRESELVITQSELPAGFTPVLGSYYNLRFTAA